MEALELYLIGWEHVFNFITISYLSVGVVVGVLFGALPGIGATAGVAIFVPLTYGLDMFTALALLCGIFCGGIYGGSISATLIDIPGLPAAMMTVLEAYPLAKQGKAGLVLTTCAVFSFFGGIFSAAMLAFFAPILAGWALKFGPHEYFSVALLGVSIIIYISGDSIPKAMIAGLFGLFLATVGEDGVSAFPRYSFGLDGLKVGAHFIPVCLGLYGVAQVFSYFVDEIKHISQQQIIKSIGKIWIPSKQFFSLLRVVPRNSILGTIVGALPGTGATIGAILSYGIEKRISKTPEAFGKGHLLAIAATETSNNATTGGAMIPLLALGIPGDATTAIILGAFILHGITPGPMLFVQKPEIVSAVFIIMLLANIMFLFVGIAGAKIFPKILGIPKNILMCVIALLCFIGAFSVNNSTFDIKSVVIYGIIGFIMKKTDIPLPPVLLTLILGPLMEANFQRAMIIDPNFSGFFIRPISCSILVFIIAIGVLPLILGKLFKPKTPLNK